jgi:hypothetical protein
MKSSMCDVLLVSSWHSLAVLKEENAITRQIVLSRRTCFIASRSESPRGKQVSASLLPKRRTSLRVPAPPIPINGVRSVLRSRCNNCCLWCSVCRDWCAHHRVCNSQPRSSSKLNNKRMKPVRLRGPPFGTTMFYRPQHRRGTACPSRRPPQASRSLLASAAHRWRRCTVRIRMKAGPASFTPLTRYNPSLTVFESTIMILLVLSRIRSSKRMAN